MRDVPGNQELKKMDECHDKLQVSECSYALDVLHNMDGARMTI